MVACRRNSAALGFNFYENSFSPGASMPDGIPRSRAIDPLCARCGSELRFSCIEPEMNKPGFVHRVYECIRCRSTQSFVTPKEVGAR